MALSFCMVVGLISAGGAVRSEAAEVFGQTLTQEAGRVSEEEKNEYGWLLGGGGNEEADEGGNTDYAESGLPEAVDGENETDIRTEDGEPEEGETVVEDGIPEESGTDQESGAAAEDGLPGEGAADRESESAQESENESAAEAGTADETGGETEGETAAEDKLPPQDKQEEDGETADNETSPETAGTEAEADQIVEEIPAEEVTAEEQKEQPVWVIVSFDLSDVDEADYTFAVKPAYEDIPFPSKLTALVREESGDEERERTAEIPVEWVCEDYEESQADAYVFCAEWDEEQYPVCEGETPELTVRIEEESPTVLYGEAGDLEVEVHAQKGVIPKGALLQVTQVTDEDELVRIRTAVEGSRGEADEGRIRELIPLDIVILLDGEEIQPEGELQVMIRDKGADSVARSDVFYVAEDRTTAEDMGAEQREADVEFATTHFSTYAMVRYSTLGRNPEVEVGEGKSYDSLAAVIEALESDTGALTIRLEADTEDHDTVVFPRDKGISRITITGGDDYLIGKEALANVCANGIPMVFEAGTADTVVGGGYNQGVDSTDLTVTGGRFKCVVGGCLVDQDDADASISGTVKLTFDHMSTVGKEDPDNFIYNQIYGGTSIGGASKNVTASIERIEVRVLDSEMALDMLSGGGEMSDTWCSYYAPVGEIVMIIQDSRLKMGMAGGISGGPIINGGEGGRQEAPCGDIQINVINSDIDGDIFGGAYGQSHGGADTGNISITGKNSNMPSIYAGGCFQGHFKLKTGDISVILDNCRIGGSHWFTEGYSIIGAGIWYGEGLSDPETDLHIETGDISFQFLSSVTDNPEDGGEPGLLLLPGGFVERGTTAKKGKTQLILSAETEFINTNDTLDELKLTPPDGYYFSAAATDDGDISLDENGCGLMENLPDGLMVTTQLADLVLKDQPPLSIGGADNGKIKKTLGEPDFRLEATGGAETLTPKYSSSNPAVAQVGEDGTVHLTGAGAAVLTVTKKSLEYRPVSAQVELTVEAPPAAVIPEELPDETGYVLVAKKVEPEVEQVVQEALTSYSEITEEATVLTMDIKLVERTTGNPVEGMGASFTIAYPSEELRQNRDQYEFFVVHIPKSGASYLVPVTLTDSGIRVTVDGFSPFILVYKQKEEAPETPVFHPERDSDSGGDGGDEAVTGRWIQNGTDWWYRYSNGTWPSSQWAFLPSGNGSAWYYFDARGYMKDGWLELNGSWYFLHNQPDGTRGYMYTGWHEIGGKQYYFETKPGAECGKLYVNRMTPDGHSVGGDGAMLR